MIDLKLRHVWLDVETVGRIEIVEWDLLFSLVVGPRRVWWRRGANLLALTRDGLSLLAHECGHVQQVRELGRWRYLWRYLWLGLLTLGTQHPMERDADERAVIIEPHATHAALLYYAGKT